MRDSHTEKNERCGRTFVYQDIYISTGYLSLLPRESNRFIKDRNYIALTGIGVKGTAKPCGTVDMGLRDPSAYVVKREVILRAGKNRKGGYTL
jgi:hypothetical protein